MRSLSSRMQSAGWWSLVCGLSLHFLLSPHALLSLGYPYEAPLLGPFPFKIHPGTYLVALAAICFLVSRGHPLKAAGRVAASEPLLAVHFGAVVLALAWLLWRHGTSGAAFMIDTHWLPALVALSLLHVDDRHRVLLLKGLLALALANAAIALAEAAGQARLVPLYLQGQSSGFAQEDHFRASALLGHPLTNAKMAATLLPIALLVWSRGVARWAAVALIGLSLLAFGGRASLGIAVLGYGAYAGLQVLRGVLTGRYSYLQLVGGSLAAIVALALLVGVVVATGLGERIFANLYLDNSASVRLRVWQAYELVSLEQLLFGISAREIDSVALRLGLDLDYEAIENGWIYLSLQLGLLAFGVWFVGFMCLVAWVMRQAAPLAAVGVAIYLLVASTTNSLASKTITQGLLVTYAVASGAAARRQAARASVATAPRFALGSGGAVAPHRFDAVTPALDRAWSGKAWPLAGGTR